MSWWRLAAWTVVTIAAAASVVAQTARLTFEVASIKRRDPSASLVPVKTPPDSPLFYVPSATVASLIQYAYGIRGSEIVGGPEWVRRIEFEIDARAAAGSSSDDKRMMVRSLLEDRFGLVVRREQRDRTFSVVVMSRSDGQLGPRLRKCGSSASTDAAKPVLWPRGGVLSFRRCAPIAVIAESASRVLGDLVVDGTGLTGLWDYDLVFLDPAAAALHQGPDAVPAVDPALVAFPTALREQLGLSLETRRGPVDVLVIESVQQPSQN